MAAPRTRTPRKNDPVAPAQPVAEPVFSAYNYRLIALGIGMIVVGFAAMAIEDQWDGFVSLYIAPVLIVAGFAELVWAIMAKEPEKKD